MHTQTDNKDNHAELRAKFEYEAIRLLAEQGRTSLIITLINSAIIFGYLNPGLETNFLAYWVAMLAIISFARLALIRVFFTRMNASSRLGNWLFFYILLVYATAACWGILPLTEYFRANVVTQSFIIFVIAGMSAGALVSLFALLRAIIPYLLILVLPLIYALTVGSDNPQLAMAVLGSLYLLMLVRSAYVLNESAIKTLRLEIQNEELFEFLLKSNRIPEAQEARK